MAGKTLKDLLVHALKDIYFAENAIYKALPKMIEGAHSIALKDALKKHRDETEVHISRLEEAFMAIDMKPQSTPCAAIKGILEEGDELLEMFGGAGVGDAAVVFACQAVEHYEINRYGSMQVWALELGMKDVAALLANTLDEEYAADQTLTDLAEGGINEAGEEDSADHKTKAKRAHKASSRG